MYITRLLFLTLCLLVNVLSYLYLTTTQAAHRAVARAAETRKAQREAELQVCRQSVCLTNTQAFLFQFIGVLIKCNEFYHSNPAVK
jgi:CHASE3 domain sensor protein